MVEVRDIILLHQRKTFRNSVAGIQVHAVGIRRNCGGAWDWLLWYLCGKAGLSHSRSIGIGGRILENPDNVSVLGLMFYVTY